MSALWQVSVEKKEGATVWLRVRTVHPDSGSLDTRKTLVIRFMEHSAFIPKSGDDPHAISFDVMPGSPLGELLGEEDFSDIVATRTADKVIAAITMHEVTHPDFDSEALEASLPSEEWSELWSDPSRLPSALYEITATDPKWIEHLIPGEKWWSAAS